MSERKSVNLALQGGGAHGALTWGVLDYLLEDGRIFFDGVTATSAGAINGVALAQGLVSGDRDNAREVLEKIWLAVSQAGFWFSPVRRSGPEMAAASNPFMPDWSMEDSLSFNIFQSVTHAVSPYQFNPMNFNPLRLIIEQAIDFDKVNRCQALNLFINATNVRTGTAEVFRNGEITADVVIASTALPFLFQAVTIDGEEYWDGGYMGNPSLWPLFYHAKCRDILIVHINPIFRDETPTKSYEIENRMNEITFNASLLKELRSIAFVKKLINGDMLKDKYKAQYKDILIHAIRSDESMCGLSIASKFDTNWQFLTYLRDKGREQAKLWLDENFKHVNKRDSVDIEKDYLRL